MIRRAIAASVPFQWVAADSVHGVGEVEQMLRRAEKGYVLAQTTALIRWSTPEIRRIATRLARRRIQSSDVIARSYWRRAHQAVAWAAYIRQKTQL